MCAGRAGVFKIQRNNDVLAERLVFYDMGKVKTGRHGLCYVGHQFVSGDMEEELLIYHILLQLQGRTHPTRDRPYAWVARPGGSVDRVTWVAQWGMHAASATEPFDLVLDATMFSEENEINVPWMRELHKLVPAAVLANIHSVVVLNPSNGIKWASENAMRIDRWLAVLPGALTSAYATSACMPRCARIPCAGSRVLLQRLCAMSAKP